MVKTKVAVLDIETGTFEIGDEDFFEVKVKNVCSYCGREVEDLYSHVYNCRMNPYNELSTVEEELEFIVEELGLV